MLRLWSDRAMPSAIRSEFDHAMHVNGSAEESPEDPLRDLPGAHAVVAGARRIYDGDLMDRYPEMKVICRTGIGIDNVVVPDATARGVAVCHTPDGPTLSTAETAVALILAAVKNLKSVSRAFAEQPERDYLSGYQGVEVFGRTLGLIGLGRIGSRVARLAAALGMRVAAYDPYIGISGTKGRWRWALNERDSSRPCWPDQMSSRCTLR